MSEEKKMALPKFGLVSIGVHDDVLNWVAKYKPVSIIIVNERGESRPGRPWESNEIDAMRWAMNASPKTLWIIRSWPDGIGEGPDDWTLPTRLVKCFEPFMDMPNPKMGHSYNEPGFPWIGSSGDARKLTNIERNFAMSMHNAGLLSMNFCFSESHILKGNMGLWEIYAEALPHVGALGFNEYDWRTVLTSRAWNNEPGPYKWRIGHWEYQVRRLQKVLGDNWAIPPVIIGEGILDGKIWTNALPEGDPMRGKPYGYKHILTGKGYARAHQVAHDDTYHKPQVFSHHTFCYCHPSSEWRSYNIKGILPQLGEQIQNQVYWADSRHGSNEPGGGSMETDSPLATWREGVPLGNYSKIGADPIEKTKIVLHSTDGPFTQAVNWFLDRASGVSAHYIIGRGHAGEPKIYQMVRESDIAHHAGDWQVNTKSIGIECADDKLDHLTDPQRERLVALLKDIAGRYPHIGPRDILLHRDVVPTQCPQAISDHDRVDILWEVYGIDPPPNILEGIARIKSKAQGARYLLEQIEQEADAIEEKLL